MRYFDLVTYPFRFLRPEGLLGRVANCCCFKDGVKNEKKKTMHLPCLSVWTLVHGMKRCWRMNVRCGEHLPEHTYSNSYNTCTTLLLTELTIACREATEKMPIFPRRLLVGFEIDPSRD